MVLSDLESVVGIHLESFPGFFLTFLGHDFLALLYKSMQSDPESVALVASSDGQIEGFVAGVMHQSGFYQRLIKRQKWAFAVAALGALLRRPAIAPRLLRALRQSAEAQQASAEACLMSIAVRPESEGKGIGKQLVTAFCQELAKRGVPAVCLTTDRDNNDRVNHFYQQLGFCLSQSYVTPEGRAMNEYLILLDKEAIDNATNVPVFLSSSSR
jgi:ribosomal protein S18 acetylase RimI-like enzyme